MGKLWSFVLSWTVILINSRRVGMLEYVHLCLKTVSELKSKVF